MAAGVLGPNSPAPFKAGLAQELVWDGKADYGKPSAGGPFKVRVALGLGAKHDRIFSRPEVVSGHCTLAVGPDGALYVQEASMAATHWWHRRLAVLNRDGSYRRTLLPFASTPGGEGARGLPVIALRGRPAPADRGTTTDLMSWLGMSPTSTMGVSADGKILYLPVGGGARPAEIVLVSTEGGGLVGRHPLDKSKIGELPEFGDRSHMAVSSDGKSLFLFGLRDRRSKVDPAAVYRVRLPDCTGLEVFFGERNTPGKGPAHLGAVAGGLATDGRGNLLICDTANNRIVVVSEADGKRQGEIACDSPWNVGAHRASGAVYVASRGPGGSKLTKFSAWQKPAKVCEMPLPRKGAGNDTVNMVVDGAAERAVIWLALSRCGYGVRVEDRGEKFEASDLGGPWEDLPGDKRRDMGYTALVVDRITREVYASNGTRANWERFDDDTGKSEFVTLTGAAPGTYGAGTQLVPGADGFLYTIAWRYWLSKWDRTGKRVIWEDPHVPSEAELAWSKHKPPPPGPGKQAYARVGMVDVPHTLGVRYSDGHIFVFEPLMNATEGGGRIPKALHEYLPTGKRVTAVDSPIIWKVSDPAVGPKFDAAGNIYVAEVVRPKGWLYPPEWAAFFAGQEGAALAGSSNAVAGMYGSIVKFGPKGGMVHFDDKDDPFTGQARLDPGLKSVEADYFRGSKLFPVKLTGAEWIHPGVGHVGFYACNCENMTFDVDEFGRVFFPDLCMYQVRVIDTAGNAITTIGGYGNADNCGPDSAVIDAKTGQPRPRRADDPKDLKSPFAEPEVAMSWPTGVGVTDRHLYVADGVNRRMVRGRLTCAAEESCPIR